MEIIFWAVVFIVSLGFLVKGSELFLNGAECVGLKRGLSPFVIGVILVGIGTSLPELVSGLAAVWKGVTEIVVANAIGSNVANILLVIGIVAIIGKKLEVTKDLIDVELPVMAISIALFFGVVYDGTVTFIEALLLVFTYLIYLAYSLGSHKQSAAALAESEKALGLFEREDEDKGFIQKINSKRDYILFIAGAAVIFIGAKYLIDSVIALSGLLNIAPGVISITAIAISERILFSCFLQIFSTFFV